MGMQFRVLMSKQGNSAMTKLTIAKGMTQAELFAGVASNYATGGAKTANDIVNKALESYKKTAMQLHIAACVTFFHASETGDSRPLTAFFNGLRQNDRDALRVWAGKLATIKSIDAEGKPNETVYLGFKKDAGFVIKKSTEALRSGYWNLVDLLNGRSFQDVDQEKEKPTLGLAELLAMLARVEKKAVKQADDNDLVIPEAIMKQLSALSSTVAGQMTSTAKH